MKASLGTSHTDVKGKELIFSGGVVVGGWIQQAVRMVVVKKINKYNSHRKLF